MTLLDIRRQLKLETIEGILSTKSGIEEFKPLFTLVQHLVTVMLKFANIQTIANKCEVAFNSMQRILKVAKRDKLI